MLEYLILFLFESTKPTRMIVISVQIPPIHYYMIKNHIKFSVEVNK